MQRYTKPSVAVVGGGMAGLEVAGSLTALEVAGSLTALDPDMTIDVFERGSFERQAHVGWDTNVYPGDEKTQRWTSKDWGHGGGLNERLGGRSLCYHGVLMGIEDSALEHWPEPWRRRLTGIGGLYNRIKDELAPDFPLLANQPLTEEAQALGLIHTPQAVVLEKKTNLFRAYTPLTKVMTSTAGGQIRVIPESIHSLSAAAEGRWSVVPEDVEGRGRQVYGPYDFCVLGASAIGNVQLLAKSLDCELQTSITDHFGFGILVSLPGNGLQAAHHLKLWAGHIPLPDLHANVFLKEVLQPANERVVDVSATVEQAGARDLWSSLTVTREGDTHIEANISSLDSARLVAVMERVGQLVDTLTAGNTREVPTKSRDIMTAYSSVLKSSTDTAAVYSFPYGSFEHEASTHPIGDEGPLPITNELEVVDMPGVFVAGPGTFPRMGTANPALTILATSRTISETIADRVA